MFSKESYNELKKSPFFKRFIFYCVIGAVAFAVIGALFVCVGMVGFPNEDFAYLFELSGIGFLCVPATFIISAATKPCICTEGKIVSVKGNYAVVEVGEMRIKATSFEHFLSNKGLDGYRKGDKILVYSGGKKPTRPLFYHVK